MEWIDKKKWQKTQQNCFSDDMLFACFIYFAVNVFFQKIPWYSKYSGSFCHFWVFSWFFLSNVTRLAFFIDFWKN